MGRAGYHQPCVWATWRGSHRLGFWASACWEASFSCNCGGPTHAPSIFPCPDRGQRAKGGPDASHQAAGQRRRVMSRRLRPGTDQSRTEGGALTSSPSSPTTKATGNSSPRLHSRHCKTQKQASLPGCFKLLAGCEPRWLTVRLARDSPSLSSPLPQPLVRRTWKGLAGRLWHSA